MPAVTTTVAPERGGQLDGHRADAARAAVHEHSLAAAQPRRQRTTFDQTVQATSGSAAASPARRRPGSGSSWPAGHGDPLGVAAAGEQRAHLVADLPAGSTPSPTSLTTPLHSSPRISVAPGGGG